jgi:hypothetical protein
MPLPDAVKAVQTPDLATQTQAITDLKQQLLERPREMAAQIQQSRVLDAMIAMQRNVEAAEICLLCLNAQADRMDRVQYFMGLRTQALLNAKQYEQALVAAKCLFNVQTIRGTPQAILLLARVLPLVRPEDSGIAQRFKLQQITLAESGSGPNELPAELGNPILPSIKVDPKLYDGNGLRAEHNSEWRRMGEGNLALLSDDPEKAMQIFRALSFSSNTAVKQAALEAIARAMKARDGGIAAANAYIADLYQKTNTPTP